jgi:phosphoenolpyruvate---glycerone phosphotransferase subunit DhaL
MNTHRAVQSATQTLIDHVDELTALDQAIGDGDHGLNMRRGSLAIQAKLPELEGQSLNAVLKALGMVCMGTIGGSSGPVFGTLLVTMGKELPAAPAPVNAADIAAALAASIAALTKLGKAEVGQKTLLDVLDPVQKVLATGGEHMLERVRECAHASASATAQMDASRGRASFLGDRALGHVDPGSRSMALIIGAVCDAMQTPAP